MYQTQILRDAGDVLLAMVSMKQPINRDGALELLKELSGSDSGQDVAAWKDADDPATVTKAWFLLEAAASSLADSV